MMVQKFVKSSALSFGTCGRCSLTAIFWSLALWILLIHAYTTLYPPNHSVTEPQIALRHHSLYRQPEDLGDKSFDWTKFPVKDRRSPSRRQKSRKSFAVTDFLNVSSPRRHFYFPGNDLVISPLHSSESDKYYFYPGRIWVDTEGTPIQAHGGGLLYVAETRTFYWYGENKDGPTYHAHKRSAARVDIIGVNCYSSNDLWTWKNEGIVLAAELTNKTHDLYTGNVLERPKVIYNDRTGRYVMWMHIDNANYSKAYVGVAVSLSPLGPFHYVTGGRPHGFDSRDMTIFKDDDGQAYLLYSSEGNSELHIGVMTDDYLDLKGIMRRTLVGQHREAPAVFKHKRLYYMISSGCTGWAPNTALVHSAESMFGPWETLGNPCLGGSEEARKTTFFSQGTFVLPLPGLQDTFVFMADRWNPDDLKDSRYVWLPLTMDGPADEPLEDDFEFPLWSRVSIRWHKKWKLPEGWNSSSTLEII